MFTTNKLITKNQFTTKKFTHTHQPVRVSQKVKHSVQLNYYYPNNPGRSTSQKLVVVVAETKAL